MSYRREFDRQVDPRRRPNISPATDVGQGSARTKSTEGARRDQRCAPSMLVGNQIWGTQPAETVAPVGELIGSEVCSTAAISPSFVEYSRAWWPQKSNSPPDVRTARTEAAAPQRSQRSVAVRANGLATDPVILSSRPPVTIVRRCRVNLGDASGDAAGASGMKHPVKPYRRIRYICTDGLDGRSVPSRILTIYPSCHLKWEGDLPGGRVDEHYA